MLTYLTVNKVKHDSMCVECEDSADKLSVAYDGENREWVAYYVHDIGEGGASFQNVAVGDTEEEVRKAVGLPVKEGGK